MFNNPLFKELLDQIGNEYFQKFLTDKEYQKKILDDLRNLNTKLEEIEKQVEEKKQEENKKD